MSRGGLRSTSFKPGQTGNPGGRPKGVMEVRELARQHTPEAIERLVYWMRSDHPSASVAAAEKLLERGWGKAIQTLADADGQGPIQHKIIIEYVKPEPAEDEQIAEITSSATAQRVPSYAQ